MPQNMEISTLMASINQQLVQFSQISAAKSIIIAHEDLECIGG